MYHPLLQTCRAFQPDVIVADMTTLAAHDVAESLKLPLALLGSMPLSLALDLTGQRHCCEVQQQQQQRAKLQPLVRQAACAAELFETAVALWPSAQQAHAQRCKHTAM